MKYIVPICIALLVLGTMLVMSGGARPFIAHLFSADNGEGRGVEEIDLDAQPAGSVIAEISSAPRARRVASVAKVKIATAPRCASSSSVAAARNVLINEVAWMGSAGDVKKEWIELKNVSAQDVSLAGWELLDKSRRIDVDFPHATLSSQGFLVLMRGKDFMGTVNNSDETLSLFDATCALVDEVRADPAWPAGSDVEWKTAERSPDLSWHTSRDVGGTLGAENSIAEHTTNDQQRTTGEKNATTTRTTTQNSSTPANLMMVRISEVMAGGQGDSDYDFVELYNDSDQPLLLTGATIKKKSSTGKESTLVAASRLEGRAIPAHGYLLLANEKGYTGSVRPDVAWPSSYSLSGEKNGLTIYDAKGSAVDAAVWTSIPDGQSLVRDAWNVSTFHLSPTPTPHNLSSQ